MVRLPSQLLVFFLFCQFNCFPEKLLDSHFSDLARCFAPNFDFSPSSNTFTLLSSRHGDDLVVLDEKPEKLPLHVVELDDVQTFV